MTARQVASDRPRGAGALALGVRVHLVVLALIALLPAWGLAGYAAWRFAGTERARVLDIAQGAARDIATGVEREAAAIRASLAALATSPALLAGDLIAFDHQLGLLYGGGALAVALEPTREEATEARPVLRRDPAGGRPVVLFRQRLLTGRDDPAQLVLRTDAVRFWSAVIERARLPQGWVAAILDPDDTILARWPDPARFIGQPVHPAALAVVRAAPRAAMGGSGSGSTREGEPVHIAWRRVDSLPWTVLVGVPVEAVDGALRRAMLPVVVIGLPLLLALSFATAWWGARRIARPLRALEETASRAAGQGLPHPPAASGVREIDAAGQALAAAAERLRLREAEIDALAARLEAVLESTTDCVIVLDRSMAPLYRNRHATALLGTDAGARLPFGADFLAAFERAFATGAPVSLTAPVAGAPGSAPRWFAAEAYPSPQGLTVFFRDVTAARAAEQALRAGEARLQAVLDHVPVGVVLAEAPSGRIVLTNRRSGEILGIDALQADAVAGYGRFEAFDAEGRPVPAEQRAVARALRGEMRVRDEYRFRRGDGRLVWVRIMAAPIRDAEGRVSGVVAALTDIEAERHAEAALRESELRFRVLAEAVPQIVWSCLPDGTLDYLNPRYFEFTGEPAEGPLAARELPIHPEERRATGHAWRSALATGAPYEAEYRMRRADGAWRWFVARALPARDAEGAIRRWIGTANDVTELIETRQALERQVAAEAMARQEAVRAAGALAASEARFRGFAEASPDVLWMLEPGGDRLSYLSPAYEDLWGEAAPAEPRLSDLTRGLDPADAPVVERLLPRLLAGEPVQAEVRIHRPDAEMRWMRLTSFEIGEGAAGGALVGGVARDITRRKEADQRQRLLIGELNHRVKNTLATVLALARQTERSARRAASAQAEGIAASAQAEGIAASAQAEGIAASAQVEGAASAQAEGIAASAQAGGIAASAQVGGIAASAQAEGIAASAQAQGAAARAQAAADAAFVADFQARLMALARGHDLLTASTWRGAMLHEVAAASLSPWRDEEGGALRIRLDGPAVWLAPRQALGLALAIHEMATNAAKHGALRLAEGQVDFAWRREPDGAIVAQWLESGGPPVTPPESSGFGTRLLRHGLGTELGQGSEITLDYAPEGFRASMRFQPLRDGDDT